MISVEFECDTKDTIIEALAQIEDNFIIQTISKNIVSYTCFPKIKISFDSFLHYFHLFQKTNSVKILSCSEADSEVLISNHTVEDLFKSGFLIISS